MKGKRLWGTSPPGAGKTFLVSRIQNRMNEQQKQHGSDDGKLATAFLYMREDRSYSCEELLGCILRQLVEHMEIPAAVWKAWGVRSEGETGIGADVVVQLIRNMADNHKLYLVVDAWDEYRPTDRGRLLGRFAELDGCLALLMTSRFIGDFDKGFEGFNHVKISANEDDIRNYVHYCINTNSRLKEFCRMSKDLEPQIASIIIKKSQGMFLLVRLHMESLETEDVCTLHAIQEKLDSFSNSLTDKYQDIMNRIRQQTKIRQNIAISTLAWVTYAQRPLSVDEVRHALAVDLTSGLFQADMQPLQADITAFCCGMVIVENDTLQLVHVTAREFMLGLKETSDDFINFDATISQVCAVYLCIPELEQPDENSVSYATEIWGRPPETYDEREIFRVQSGLVYRTQHQTATPRTGLTFKSKLRIYPLIQYAAQYLGHHLRAISDANCIAANNALNKTISVLQERPKRKFFEEVLYQVCSYPPQALSRQNYPLSISEPECGSDSENDESLTLSSDDGGREPLLTGQGSDSGDCRDITSLHLAAHLGVARLVKQLLSDLSLVNVKDFNGCTPLSIALAAGHLDTALLILNAGAKLDLLSNEGCQLLLIAAQSGSPAGAVIRCILQDALHIRGRGGNIIAEQIIWLLRFTAVKMMYYWAKVSNKCQRLWSKMEQGRRCEPSRFEPTPQPVGCHLLRRLLPYSPGRKSVTFVDLPTDGDMFASIPSQSARGFRRRRLARTVTEAIMSPSEYVKRKYLNLVAAAFQNDTKTITKLIQKEGVFVDNENLKRRGCYWSLVNLALFLAVERKNINGVKALVEGGVDVNSRDYGARTPLHRAVIQRNSQLVEFLLGKEAEVNAKDARGDTPWVLAASTRDEKMSKLLIRHGADVNTQRRDGDNKLYSAAAGGDVSDLKFLISQGVDPSITTNLFWAPLHKASENGHIECVKLLLDAGAVVSPVSDTGMTPLDMAIERKQVDIQQLLRSKDAKRGIEVWETNGGPKY
ncbi:hypothetical protein F4859DRAFT_524356 [Xylaria cf. heliscus]|nr:hypothetical protein F4859DRAFT_524356 [Xylaria cf. heliscus]